MKLLLLVELPAAVLDTAPQRAVLLFQRVCSRLETSCVLQVTMDDFMLALKEVKPAFGAVTETLNQYRLNDIINWGPGFMHLATTCKTLTEQVGLDLARI